MVCTWCGDLDLFCNDYRPSVHANGEWSESSELELVFVHNIVGLIFTPLGFQLPIT